MGVRETARTCSQLVLGAHPPRLAVGRGGRLAEEHPPVAGGARSRAALGRRLAYPVASLLVEAWRSGGQLTWNRHLVPSGRVANYGNDAF